MPRVAQVGGGAVGAAVNRCAPVPQRDHEVALHPGRPRRRLRRPSPLAIRSVQSANALRASPNRWKKLNIDGPDGPYLVRLSHFSRLSSALHVGRELARRLAAQLMAVEALLHRSAGTSPAVSWPSGASSSTSTSRPDRPRAAALGVGRDRRASDSSCCPGFAGTRGESTRP